MTVGQKGIDYEIITHPRDGRAAHSAQPRWQLTLGETGGWHRRFCDSLDCFSYREIIYGGPMADQNLMVTMDYFRAILLFGSASTTHNTIAIAWRTQFG
jgi:hypothetical protein